jgi:hypothetical protein
MTQEEIIRFAQMLTESDKVRARIAEDEESERIYDLAFQEVHLEAAA